MLVYLHNDDGYEKSDAINGIEAGSSTAVTNEVDCDPDGGPLSALSAASSSSF